MTSIEDINYDEIELFLKLNNENISSNHKDSYDIAWMLIQHGAVDYTDSIIEWMKAYNLLQLEVDIPIYNKSDIESASQNELKAIAKLLTLNTPDIDHISNVLRYLHKLNEVNDVNLNYLSILPEDAVVEIFNNSNIDEINMLCSTSNKMRTFCESKRGRDIIISKIPPDSLDISNYTFDELILYSKVVPLKQRMSMLDIMLYVLSDKGLIAINLKDIQIDSFSNENINQVVPGGMNYTINVLYNDGDVHRKILTVDRKNPTVYADNIISISDYIHNREHIILAINSSGSYIESNGLKWTKIITPFKIIQKNGDLILSSEGDVYITSPTDELKLYVSGKAMLYKLDIFGKVMSYKSMNYVKISGLPKIKQITSLGFILSAKGEVHKINFTNADIIKYRIKNVSQISASDFNTNYLTNDANVCVVLNNKGNVFIIKNNNITTLPTMPNVIEIIAGSKYIATLTSDNIVETFSSLSGRTMMEPPYDLNTLEILYGE